MGRVLFVILAVVFLPLLLIHVAAEIMHRRSSAGPGVTQGSAPSTAPEAPSRASR
jgi:hypothetical protein